MGLDFLLSTVFFNVSYSSRRSSNSRRMSEALEDVPELDDVEDARERLDAALAYDEGQSSLMPKADS